MRRVLLALAAVVVLAVAGVVAFVLVRKHQSRNIRGSPTVEFVTTNAKPKEPPPGGKIRWPMYRFDAPRLGVSEGILAAVRPPYRPLWYFRAHSLVEFPPAVGYGRLYFANADGTLFAVDTKRVKPRWIFRAGRCTAATPALDDRTVYMSFMNRPPCNATRSGIDGEVVALNADTGRVRWRKRMGPTESSPLVVNGTVYVGDWNGKVYALDARSGRVRWSYATGGQVKDAVAYAGGRVYVGSYDHHVYALTANTGKLVWRASAQQRLGSQATFYSTPAVAYGRVYIGGTDGKVYSFGATSGKLRWSHGTGRYVYASPAVWNRRVYVGSYDGDFYCFDAATGDVRWKFAANGAISGSAVVINGLVYFSTLKNRTYALDATSGKLVWGFRRGTYASVVSDRRRLYLVGYSRIFSMAPRLRK
ncbi:MAG TPA: PQQ-binding-like beta-propeller repeat protein [Gaiellaceae bacterium]|jgi:outer membrane protein assembly factor BamB|nr:PQQ-binding-like beta-propeller repeat protein [Gaiellaceae bacterium]